MDQNHGQAMMELMHWKVGGWQAIYTHEPPGRGETDAKQVQNTRQTGARTMTSNRKPLHSSRNAGPSVLGVSDGLFVYGLNETELETLKLRKYLSSLTKWQKLYKPPQMPANKIWIIDPVIPIDPHPDFSASALDVAE